MSEHKPAPTGWATVDYSTRPGVQTYQDVYGNTNTNDAPLRLKDVLVQLGEEIREAAASAARDGKHDLMKIKDCTVELGLTWEAKGDAGVEFWVVKLGGSVTRTSTQTITLTLEPIEPIIAFLNAVDSGANPPHYVDGDQRSDGAAQAK